MRTVPDRFSVDDFLAGDHPVICAYCSCPFPVSQMHKDGAGNWVCPQEGDGLDAVTLSRLEADAVSRPPRKPKPSLGREPRQPTAIKGLLPGLAVDWDPSKAVVDSDGEITAWVAQMTRLRALPESGHDAPSVTSSDPDFNGLASVGPTDFTVNTGDRLSWSSHLPATPGDQPAAFVVAKVDEDDDNTRLLVNAPPFFSIRVTGGAFGAQAGGGAALVSLTGPSVDTDLHVFCVRYTDDGIEFRIDGDVEATSSTPTEFAFGGTLTGGYGLGAYRPAVSQAAPWYGRYGRFLWATEATDAQVAAVEAELMSLYGIES